MDRKICLLKSAKKHILPVVHNNENSMAGYLFILAWTLGVSSWFLAIIEMISLHSFWGIIFKVGIPVKRTSLEINTEKFHPEIGNTISMEEGKFRFTNERKVFFLSQFFLFRFTTPFPFKVIATISPNNKVDIVARIPLGTTLFLLFWILGWTIGSIGFGIQSGNFSSVGFGLIGWLFAGLMIGISYPIEKRRFELMISELKQIITENVHNRVDPTPKH
ncbi:MAG: hypothetical protein KKF98_06060 [Bacteroidetes bacterium]|nr:hypothetical protein [Bacteroidota bacterium]